MNKIWIYCWVLIGIGGLTSCQLVSSEGRNIDGLIQELGQAGSAKKDSIFQVLDRSMLLDKDLPTIYEGIRQTYEDDSLREKSSKAKLITLLETTHDESTASFLRSQFEEWENQFYLQKISLITLTKINSPSSIEVFTELLQQVYKPMGTYSESFFYPIIENPQHADLLFPHLFPLLDQRDYTFVLLQSLEAGLASGSILPEMIQEDLLPIRETFRKQVKFRERFAPGSGSYLQANNLMLICMRCLSYFPQDQLSQQVLALASEDPDIDMRLAALLIQLDGDTTGTAARLQALASDVQSRNRLYEVLSQKGKRELFPATYQNQEALAAGDLANWLNQPSHRAAFPKDMELIERLQLQAAEDQEEAYFYLFRFRYGATWEVGISGPQPQDTTEVVATGYLTGSKYLAEDARTIAEHVEELIAN